MNDTIPIAGDENLPENPVLKDTLHNHRHIPELPLRPHIHPVSNTISRSYPVGKQSFSRAFQGMELKLSITSRNPFPEYLDAKLMTTMLSENGSNWVSVPFERIDAYTLMCRIVPEYPGLHSFRAEYQFDNGNIVYRDTVPDAWILIDPPQVDGLRMYTFIPTVSGTLNDWKIDLKRIASMGFNALHLLPITMLDESESPYAANDLFDIDPSYLTIGSDKDSLQQLEAFIEEAKVLGIRLCFDLVLNHIGVSSKMVKRAPDWIVPDQNSPDGFQRARYWFNNVWSTWDDLVLINYEHPSEAARTEIWSYMIDYALFWAKYANDTNGFVRFDNLHSSDADFVAALTKALQKEYPSVAILAEYFTDERTMLDTVPEWGLNLVLAMPWNYKFVPELREYLKYLHRVSEHVEYFMPVTSHDCGSPSQEFGCADSTVPRYVAAALLGTGATGMPQGVEYGEQERINFVGRKPKMEFKGEATFAGFISKVNNILSTYSTFRCGNNCEFVDNDHLAIIAAFRKDDGSQTLGFLVVCNFDIQSPQHIVLNLNTIIGSPGPFMYTDLLSEDSKNNLQDELELLLPPCSAKVLMFNQDV